MIKEWGFLLKPTGDIGTNSRALILIGYPFSFITPIPIVVEFIEPNLAYYRNYILDLSEVLGKQSEPPIALSFTLTPDLTYFKKYLGEF